MATDHSAFAAYPARLEVDYAEEHDRVTTLFRLVLVVPIGIVLFVLAAAYFAWSAVRRPGREEQVYTQERLDHDRADDEEPTTRPATGASEG